MNLLDFDSVESEKAYAMKKYNDRIKYMNILRAAQATAAVALIGYWLIPTAIISLETASGWFRGIAAVVDNHPVVFTLINVLIISIFVLSHEKSETGSNLYDQFTTAAPTAVVYPVPVRDEFRDKQIVQVKSRNGSDSAVERRPETRVTAVTGEEEDRVVCFNETVTAVKSTSYRRTQSERRRSSKTTEEVRKVEYRRSESSSAATASSRGLCAVERQSSKEFRVTVERFIMEKKRTLLQENDVVAPTRGHNRHFSNSSNSCSALVPI